MGTTKSDRRAHWENVYSVKRAQETSWYQNKPRISLDMIQQSGIGKNAAMIDVGGGASRLVDYLLDLGFNDLSVLDISAAALKQARDRLGAAASGVEWIEADVTHYVPRRTYDLWHDRAAFHFLTDAGDRQSYVHTLSRALKPGGTAIIATFAPDGPEKCSGLNIVRYDSTSLGKELGTKYQLESREYERHVTPAQREQSFGFYCFRKMA